MCVSDSYTDPPPQLRLLHVSHCTEITDVGVVLLSQLCTNLENIVLCNTNATDTALASLVRHCPKLSLVNIMRTTIDPLPYAHRGIRFVTDH